jgi:glycine/D-amino acid oxidase-like deaminating enzyme
VDDRDEVTKKRGVPSGSPRFTRRSVMGGMTAGALAPAVLRAATPGSAAHIAVIGAGVFGAWTAHHLQQAGHRVTLVDMAGPANDRASSGGESRMTRAAYGKDAIYARMAFDSLAQWKWLSAQAGLPIFHPCGVLFFFDSDQPYIRDSLAAHHAIGLQTEFVGPVEMARRFPMIDFTGVHGGLFEHGFGALMARRAVQTLVARFVKAGGNYLQERAEPPKIDEGRLTAVKLREHKMLGADAFIFALGPWLPHYFPSVIGSRIQPTRQEVFFFAPPVADPRFLPGQMPGWADFNGGDVYYGFPDLEGRGVKFAHDAHGTEVDPDTQSRDYTEAALGEIIAFRDRRFPMLRGAPLTESRVCQYENSSNGDFLIDRHPSMPNVVLVGGGSGHGFKHGPEAGRLAAQLALGGAQSEPRFTLATKGTAQKREVI